MNKLPDSELNPYSEAAATEILERHAKGESLRTICNGGHGHLPSEKSVRRWALEDIDGFADRYSAACAACLNFQIEEFIRPAVENEALRAEVAALRVQHVAIQASNAANQESTR